MRTVCPGFGSVGSADRTVIGYRQVGSGPTVVLVHGSMQASQNLMVLADALSADFTVVVPDRRGRGLSGPHGDDYCLAREVEDLRAVIEATGASRVFGHSSGALITLHAASGLDAIALYEPPLPVNGSVPIDWAPRYEREIARGRYASALVTVLKGLRVEPGFDRVPRFVLTPLLAIGVRARKSIRELVPTMHFDLRLVEELADTVKDVDARVLLLSGTKSPAYFDTALDRLSATIPNTQRVAFSGLGHSGPDDGGDPPRVAEALRAFFSNPS
jgi:pimeloyl-ACP methyl ester carboxylesterase